MIFGAARDLEGHVFRPDPDGPSPLVGCIEQPAEHEIWIKEATRLRFAGWACARNGAVVRGVVLVDGRPACRFACEQPRLDLPTWFGKRAHSSGFEVDLEVAVPGPFDPVSVVVEFDDGDLVAASQPFVVKHARGPRFATAGPSVDQTEDVTGLEWEHPLRARGPVPHEAELRRAIEVLGGLEGRSVLQLGSVEGSQTTVLHALGARAVVVVEASGPGYVKGLIRKEVEGLGRARFELSEHSAYLATADERFDVVVSFGALEHQAEPVAVLRGMRSVADSLVLRTRYFDGAAIDANPRLRHRFEDPPVERDLDGLWVMVHRRRYGDERDRPVFDGGPWSVSGWLSRQHLLDALERLGYVVEVLEEPERPADAGGPELTLVARS